jgi:hypothetical protein
MKRSLFASIHPDPVNWPLLFLAGMFFHRLTLSFPRNLKDLVRGAPNWPRGLLVMVAKRGVEIYVVAWGEFHAIRNIYYALLFVGKWVTF